MSMMRCVIWVVCGALLAAGEPTADETAFLAECRQIATQTLAAERTAVAGQDGWIFLAVELRHLGAGPFWGGDAAQASQATLANAQDPLPAIVDTHRQLAALGIELLVVSVPARAAVYADRLPTRVAAPKGRSDPHHRRFYQLLRQERVQVLDLTDDFLAGRAQDPELGPLCCRTDSHWSPRGLALAAGRIHSLVQERPWVKGLSRTTYASRAERLTIDGDLRSLLGDDGIPKEEIPLPRIGLPSGEDLIPVASDPTSPILLLADSHGLVFSAGEDMHTHSAGFADHLALVFGVPVELIAARGSAATEVRVRVARKAYKDESWLRAKKLVVWCFACRDLTESDGWQTVALTRKKP